MDAAKPEPMPTHNSSASMHDLVIRDLATTTSLDLQTTRAVIADVEARKAFGLSKYGTILQAGNGRDATMDAYQESLDLLVYLKQDLIESNITAHADELRCAYHETLKIALTLRRRLETRHVLR